MSKVVMAVCVGSAAAFMPPASVHQLTRATVSSSSTVEMFGGGGGSKPRKAAKTPQGANFVRPLSPGSNCTCCPTLSPLLPPCC